MLAFTVPSPYSPCFCNENEMVRSASRLRSDQSLGFHAAGYRQVPGHSSFSVTPVSLGSGRQVPM